MTGSQEFSTNIGKNIYAAAEMLKTMTGRQTAMLAF